MKKLTAIALLISLSTLSAKADLHEALDGRYLMKLQIGKQTHQDELVLKGTKRPIDLYAFFGEIQGSITVPGVFTSPLKGEAFCSSWGVICSFDFTITANEQGQSYKVRYEATLKQSDYSKVATENQEPRLTGTAYLEHGQVLGTFEAVRVKE